jgi:hypothetical protein
MAFLFLLALSFFSSPEGSTPASAIQGLAAAARPDGTVSVRFQLARAFDHPEIIQAVQSGTPTGFTYRVRLVRKRPNWFDSRLGEARIEVLCTYDSVRQEYAVHYRRNRKLVRSETVRDLSSLKQRLTQIEEAELFQTDRHPSKLRVLVQADVVRGYLFYIVPWDVTTRWSEVRVTQAMP